MYRLCLRGGRRCRGGWAPGYSPQHTGGMKGTGALFSVESFKEAREFWTQFLLSLHRRHATHSGSVRGEEEMTLFGTQHCLHGLEAGTGWYLPSPLPPHTHLPFSPLSSYVICALFLGSQSLHHQLQGACRSRDIGCTSVHHYHAALLTQQGGRPHR